jgi:oxygen-independent coproporphyrinogen III oxidase
VRYALTEAERAVYRRYAGLALPRHTSYPTAPTWITGYGADELRADLRRSAEQRRPLSLYVHVPFCQRLCYYCACTKEIVPADRRAAHDPAEDLLQGLALEAGRLSALVGPGEVRQVHLGGGTPTFLRPAQLERLWTALRSYFTMARGAEVAVEIDPRVTTRGHLETLRSLGFNRVSLGIQDFDPAVQRAVNRLQPFELVECVVGWCRELGFGSVNFDLIYGLPRQTLESMVQTLDKVLALAPDRVAFYRLAVIPEIFRWQNTFEPADLPGGDLPLDLNLLALNRFLEAGYEFIGLDHFARPDEALARARREGSLYRTFQGMTTGKPLDVLGLGPSAISQLQEAFAQNPKATADWREAVGRDLAVERGLRLSADDCVRREALQQLYGYGVIDKRALEWRFGVVFDEYFADELRRLRELREEGLVLLDPDAVHLLGLLGRFLVRVVAAVFDRYLRPNAFREGLATRPSSRVG